MWHNTGKNRPDFAIEPDSGQESVWDYPRPPALVESTQRIEVRNGNSVIAATHAGRRVLETASPPTFYIPPADIDFSLLQRVPGQSYCEWKGAADYWALAEGGEAIGWSYPDPKPAFEPLCDWLSFYPGRIECYLDGERVRGQGGSFYGGWVTDNIVGPWKGDAGTGGW